VTAPDRAAHVAWCKERALAELDAPGPLEERIVNALSSLAVDLSGNPATAGHDAIMLGTMEAMRGGLQTEQQMRAWIEGIR